MALTNNGGPTLTCLCETTPSTSPLISSGSVNLVNSYYTYPELLSGGVPIDQRGFARIVNNNVNIGSVENGGVICFREDTEIFVKNIETGYTKYLPIKYICSNTHMVYDIKTSNFVNILYNIISGTTTRFVKIPKDIVAKNIPNKDIFITSGHDIIFEGKKIKAINLPGSYIVKLPVQKVYTLCTKKTNIIYANNLKALTWSEKKFMKKIENGMVWKNNEI